MALDPVLKQHLIDRGMFDRIRELEDLEKKKKISFFGSVKEDVKKVFKKAIPKKEKPMVFRVGQGLDPRQAQKAKEVVRKPAGKTGVSIKVPGFQKELRQPEGDFGEMMKGLIEWPEKTLTSVYYAFTQPREVPFRKEKLYRVPTYQEDLKRYIDEGVSPLVALSLTGSQAVLDVAVGGQIIKNGATQVAAKLAPKVIEVEIARTAMGLPRVWTQTDRKQAFRQAAKLTHPDTVTGSESVFKTLNEANQILKASKPPSRATEAAFRGAEALTKPFGAYKGGRAPFVATRGLLPEQAGTRPAQPFVGRKPIRVGLQTREVDAVPIKRGTKKGKQPTKFERKALQIPEETFVKEVQALKSRLRSQQTGVVFGKSQVKSLQNQFVNIVRKSVQPELQGRFLSATKNIQKPEQLERAIVNLENFVIQKAKVPVKMLIRETTGQIKTDLQTFQQRIRDLARGAREGSVATKRQTKEVQDGLVEIVNNSNLDLNDKGKFLSAIKNTQTLAQLEKVLPEIDRRITYLETASERRKLKSRIQKELADTKVRKQAGKPVGKFTPETQKVLDTMRNTLNFSKEGAQKKVIENLSKYKTDVPFDVVLENKILSSFSKSSTVEELREMRNTVRKIKDTGRLTNELRKFNIEEEVSRDRGFVIERVTGGKGIEKGKITFGSKQSAVKQSLKSLGKRWVLDWQGLLETLEFNNKAGTAKLPSAFSTLDQDNLYKELEVRFVSDFEKAVIDSYGIPTKKVHKQLSKLNKKVNLGKFTNADGIKGEVVMTKDEIIKRWMELQDPTLKESFIRGNKYTDEITNAIDKAMAPQDRKFAQAQFDLYKRQYNKINPIYREIYGVDLPFNEFYSPIRRKGFNVDELEGMGEFLVDAQQRVGLTSSSLISRVKNVLPIEMQDSTQVLSRHIKETNYFVAYVKKVRHLRSVFNNQGVREVIEQEFGSGMNTAIGNTLDDLMTNGNKSAKMYKIIDGFRKNFTIGALAIKPVIGIKQMVSTLAYLEKVNPIEFTVGVLDFWKNPIKNTRILNKESSLIKTRGLLGNIERDIKAAQQSEFFKRININPSYINISMMNVRLGDKGAILTGSWALRRARIKKSMPLEDIIREYEEFSSSTQQSADLSRLSEIQRGGSFEKMFTMFKSSPRQYLQKELNAVRSLFQKGGFSKENLKRVAKVLAIYHVLLPVTFQYIANLGGWDEEDKKEYKRAAILGSLSGLFIVGDIVDGIIREALGLRVWDNEVAPFEVRNTINKGIRELDFDDITAEDMKNALSEWSEAGNFAGIPVKQAKGLFNGAKDLMEGSVKRGIAQLLGWSSYHAPKKKPISREERLERLREKRGNLNQEKMLEKRRKNIERLREKRESSNTDAIEKRRERIEKLREKRGL